jgi:dTDP-4-amino-4,6-dideoxygalactose transaminase
MKNWVPNKTIDTELVNKLFEKSLESNHFANNGPNVQLLESFIKDKFKVDEDKSVIVVTNGALALHSITSGIQYTEKINIQWATQSFTFPPSAQSNLSNVKIIDIDKDGGIDLELIDDDVNGIIVTNIFGNIVDIDKYTEWAKHTGKFLIFDNAATAYTFYKGKNSINYGNGCIISFHHTKPFGFGEGGAIIVDKKYETAIRCLNNFGIGLMTNNYWVKEGNNNKMSDVSAVYILQFLMNNFDKIVSQHNSMYSYFKDKTTKITKTTKTTEEEEEEEEENSKIKYKLFPSFHYNEIIVPSCLCLLFDNYDDNIRLKLLENNIYCRKYYYPLKNTKVACEIFDSILCISFTTETTKEDIDNIFEILCTC